MRPRIAFVIQRYGTELQGGAELYCRMIAESMIDLWDIEVLSTSAGNSPDYKNELPESDILNGVPIRRFPVDRQKNERGFQRLTRNLIFYNGCVSFEESKRWLIEQGPHSSDLIRYLSLNPERYELFFYFTSLYSHAYFGMLQTKNRSVLIPFVHDEPVMRFPIYKKIFTLPSYMIFSSQEEKDFVYSFYKNNYIPGAVIGSGVSDSFGYALKSNNEEDQEFIKSLPDRYILYAGRLEIGKGVPDLMDHFLRYSETDPSGLSLVILGGGSVTIPDHERIISFGYISESLKALVFKHAVAIVNPSHYESFSLILLEAWRAGRPVLVNGRCDVLRGQIARSQGGLVYYNFEEFRARLDELQTDNILAKRLAKNGIEYLKKNYDWRLIRNKYLKVRESVRANQFLISGG
jgi:glycosyltransferase involved in cell wall biosynthesis